MRFFTDFLRKPEATPAMKAQLSSQLAKDCEAFLRAGGEIQQIPLGQSGMAPTDFLGPNMTVTQAARANRRGK